jgi:hypothetical protein
LTEKLICCPKCGFKQEASEECVSCGIVYSKFEKRSARASESTHTNKERAASKSRGLSFRTLRIALLLIILLFVGLNAWLTKVRSTDWDQSLKTVLYPINGDASKTSSDYISSLQVDSFKDIEDFMQEEAERYGLELENPLSIIQGPPIEKLPPTLPSGSSMLSVIWWSLKMRYWAYSIDTYEGPAPDIQMFIVYYDPKEHKELDHSLGLEKGLIGVVNAFASRNMEGENNVIIAHEILHTLGATDKYNYQNDMPLYPDGYAEPEREPLYPQEAAEIMACRIPLSEGKAEMPESLFHTVIGRKTAGEIKWVEVEEGQR